jgi:hypothetical protein
MGRSGLCLAPLWVLETLETGCATPFERVVTVSENEQEAEAWLDGGRSPQLESSACNPTIIITPPPTSSQMSKESGKSVWILWNGPLVREKWSRKFRNPSISAASKPGIMPRTKSMAPKTMAVIAGFTMCGMRSYRCSPPRATVE